MKHVYCSLKVLDLVAMIIKWPAESQWLFAANIFLLQTNIELEIISYTFHITTILGWGKMVQEAL